MTSTLWVAEMKQIGTNYCCPDAVGTGRLVCLNCADINNQYSADTDPARTTMTHYETLGVEPTASMADIKAAWRKKCSENHPDRKGGNPESMAAINAAYECLSDPERRAGYDETGRDPAQGPSLDDIAEKALQLLIEQILEQSPKGDLVKLLDAAITREVKGIEKALAKDERTVERLSKQLDRVVRKSAGRSSLFNVVLQERIKRAQSDIEQGRQHLEISLRALEILRDHVDTTPDIEAPRPRSPHEDLIDAMRHRYAGNPFFHV